MVIATTIIAIEREMASRFLIRGWKSQIESHLLDTVGSNSFV